MRLGAALLIVSLAWAPATRAHAQRCPTSGHEYQFTSMHQALEGAGIALAPTAVAQAYSEYLAGLQKLRDETVDARSLGAHGGNDRYLDRAEAAEVVRAHRMLSAHTEALEERLFDALAASCSDADRARLEGVRRYRAYQRLCELGDKFTHSYWGCIADLEALAATVAPDAQTLASMRAALAPSLAERLDQAKKLIQLQVRTVEQISEAAVAQNVAGTGLQEVQLRAREQFYAAHPEALRDDLTPDAEKALFDEVLRLTGDASSAHMGIRAVALPAIWKAGARMQRLQLGAAEEAAKALSRGGAYLWMSSVGARISPEMQGAISFGMDDGPFWASEGASKECVKTLRDAASKFVQAADRINRDAVRMGFEQREGIEAPEQTWQLFQELRAKVGVRHAKVRQEFYAELGTCFDPRKWQEKLEEIQKTPPIIIKPGEEPPEPPPMRQPGTFVDSSEFEGRRPQDRDFYVGHLKTEAVVDNNAPGLPSGARLALLLRGLGVSESQQALAEQVRVSAVERWMKEVSPAANDALEAKAEEIGFVNRAASEKCASVQAGLVESLFVALGAGLSTSDAEVLKSALTLRGWSVRSSSEGAFLSESNGGYLINPAEVLAIAALGDRERAAAAAVLASWTGPLMEAQANHLKQVHETLQVRAVWAAGNKASSGLARFRPSQSSVPQQVEEADLALMRAVVARRKLCARTLEEMCAAVGAGSAELLKSSALQAVQPTVAARVQLARRAMAEVAERVPPDAAAGAGLQQILKEYLGSLAAAHEAEARALAARGADQPMRPNHFYQDPVQKMLHEDLMFAIDQHRAIFVQRILATVPLDAIKRSPAMKMLIAESGLNLQQWAALHPSAVPPQPAH